MFRFDGHTRPVRCVAFSPDGGRLASGGDDRTVRVWDRGTGGCDRVFTGHAGAIWAVAFHPGGGEVVSGGVEPAGQANVIHLWPLDGLPAKAPPDPAHSRFRDLADRVRQWEMPERLRGLVDAFPPLPSVKVRFHVPQWELPDGFRQMLRGGDTDLIHYLAFVRGGAELVTAARLAVADPSYNGSRGRVACLPVDRVTHQLGEPRPTWLDRRSHVWAAASSADGEVVAVASRQYVRVGRLDATTVPPGYAARGDVWSLALSPDGARLAGCWGDRVTVWPTAGGPAAEFAGHTAGVRAVAFAPDGSALASGALDGTVRVWDPISGAVLRGYDWGLGPVHALAFAPDGLTLAVAADEGLVLVDFE